jgi:hypothetical protein
LPATLSRSTQDRELVFYFLIPKKKTTQKTQGATQAYMPQLHYCKKPNKKNNLKLETSTRSPGATTLILAKVLE